MHPIRAGLAQPRQPFKKTDSDIGLRSLFDCMLCVIVSSPFRETGALSFDLFDFVDSVNSDLDLGTDCRYQLPSSLPGLGRLDFRIEGSPHPPVRNSTSAGSMLFLSYVSSRFIPPMISRVTSSGKPRRVGLALAHEALTAESSHLPPPYTQTVEHHLEYSLATTFVAAVGVIAFFVFKPASSSGESPPPHVHPPSPDGSGAGIPKHQWRRDAQIYGWASALLYLTSRIPQIMKNRKTYCEGLSMALFVFALLGNSTYVASIMLKSTDPEYHLLENASWLVGSLGVVFLDFIVLAQFVKYAPEREKLRLEVGCGGPGGGCAGSGPASRLILNKSKGLRSGRGLTPISSTDQLAVEGVILPLPNMKTSILPLTIAMLAVVARAAPVAPSHDIESHPSSVIPDDLQKRQIAKGSSVERVGTRKTDSLKRDGPPTPAEGASEAAVKTKRGMKTWIAAGTAGGVFLDRMVFQKIWPTLDLSSLPPYQAPPASDPSTLPSDKSKPASNQSTPPSNKSTPPYGQYAPPSPYPNKRSLSEEKDANIIRMKQEQLERLVANGVP
ncbi:hypothetical protein CF328_g6785 [Tilletia controversa]|nr:hypothetical protein CF328_g6785 [Tilletia controversa]